MSGRQHKPAFEKLVPPVGESFRCFDRSRIRSRAKWHRHPEIELTYVHSGSGTRLVGDSIGSYGDADLVLLGPELPHTWLSDAYRGKAYDRHPAIVVQFHPEFLGAEFFGAGDVAFFGWQDRTKRRVQFAADHDVEDEHGRHHQPRDHTGEPQLADGLTSDHRVENQHH